MLRYLARRLVLAAITVWAITVVTFIILQLPPGDFVDAYIAQLAASGSPVSAAQLAAIVDLIGQRTISGKIAKDLFEIVWQEGGDPHALVEARGMKQVTDLGAIEKVVDDIIAANPDKVAQARAKPQLMGWFVGQVMKSSGGKANPQVVNDLLKSKLGI